MNKKNINSGFTLIELLVVATIIIVISAIGAVSYSSAGIAGRDGKRKADMETVRQALVLYRINNGSYPPGNSTAAENYNTAINTLKNNNFISQPTPLDPKNKDSYVYYYQSYPSYPSASSTNFCLCAKLEELNKGNAVGLSSSGCVWNPNSSYYCVSNPN